MMTASPTNHSASAARRLLPAVALAFAFAAHSATVIIRPGDFPSVPSRQPVIITNISNPTLTSNFVFTVPSREYRATNTYGAYSNLVSAELYAGAYRAIIGPYRIGFNVPDDTNTYWLSELATNGNQISALAGLWISTNNLKQYVLPGTNVVFQTNGGALTISATGGGSGSVTLTNTTGLPGAIVGSGSTYGIGTNLTSLATAAIASTNSEWALFGMTFNGGQSGWPPFNVEEKGRFVYSTDGLSWVGGTGHPQFSGLNGSVRDPALIQVRDFYGLTYNTNTASQASAGFGSGSFPIYTSTNLTQWTLATNLSLLMAGETFVTNLVYHWAPVMTQVGTNIWLFGSVTTNGTSSFKQRYRTTSVDLFPHGWSAVAELNNGTGLTNIIDLNPFVDDDGTVYAWYKNESQNLMCLGRFASADPSSSFTTLKSAFDSGVEAFWVIKVPTTGMYRVYAVRFSYGTAWAEYGGYGGGQVLVYSESSSMNGAYSDWTVCTVPDYIQNFKPIIVRDTKTHVAALGATVGSMGLRGTVNISGNTERGSGGASLGGFAWNGSAMDTNDFAAINFGNEHRSRGGLYARGDGRVAIYAPTYTSTDSNVVLSGWAKDVLTARSNSIVLSVPLTADLVNSTNLAIAGVSNLTTSLAGKVEESSGVATNLSVYGGLLVDVGGGDIRFTNASFYTDSIVSSDYRYGGGAPMADGVGGGRLFYSYGSAVLTDGTNVFHSNGSLLTSTTNLIGTIQPANLNGAISTGQVLTNALMIGPTTNNGILRVAGGSFATPTIVFQVSPSSLGATELGTAITGGFGYGNDNTAPFFNLATASSTGSLFSGGVTGDAYRRVRITAAGRFLVGPGTATQDAAWERSAAGTFLVQTNLVASGTLTATNGVFGASGCLMLTTNTTAAINTATNQWTVWERTHAFGSITAGSSGLTNTVAGTYRLSITASMAASSPAEIYGLIYTNGASTGFKFRKSVLANDYSTSTAIGYMSLPANTWVNFRIGTPTTEDISVESATLELTPAN